MDWHEIAAILSGVVQFSSVVPYVWSMVKGTTRPNVISWIVWTLLQVIAITAQFSAGASWSVIILVVMTFNTVLVTFLGLVGYGYRKYGVLDWTCFTLAILAILLWRVTSNPVNALILLVAADFLAVIPTLIKTVREPYSELPLGWFLIAVAAMLSIASTTIFNTANLIYPVYLFIVNALVCIVAFVGQRVKKA